MRRHQVNSWHIHSIHVRSIADHLLLISNTSIISGACLHYKLLVGVYLYLPHVDVNKINLDSLSKISLQRKINSVNVGTKPCYRKNFFLLCLTKRNSWKNNSDNGFLWVLSIFLQVMALQQWDVDDIAYRFKLYRIYQCFPFILQKFSFPFQLVCTWL